MQQRRRRQGAPRLETSADPIVASGGDCVATADSDRVGHWQRAPCLPAGQTPSHCSQRFRAAAPRRRLPTSPPPTPARCLEAATVNTLRPMSCARAGEGGAALCFPLISESVIPIASEKSVASELAKQTLYVSSPPPACSALCLSRCTHSDAAGTYGHVRRPQRTHAHKSDAARTHARTHVNCRTHI